MMEEKTNQRTFTHEDELLGEATGSHNPSGAEAEMWKNKYIAAMEELNEARKGISRLTAPCARRFVRKKGNVIYLRGRGMGNGGGKAQ